MTSDQFHRLSPECKTYSVAFGCDVLAIVSQTTMFSSSTQYQMRPLEVTSYCHCGMLTP